MTNCLCGLNKDYEKCCGRFIEGQQEAATPEELMRSRYTAYARVNIPYIARTMKGKALENFDANQSLAWAEKVKWLKLEVTQSFLKDGKGFVEFTAYYKDQGKENALHEMSEFHQIDGKWYYVDGTYQ